MAKPAHDLSKETEEANFLLDTIGELLDDRNVSNVVAAAVMVEMTAMLIAGTPPELRFRRHCWVLEQVDLRIPKLIAMWIKNGEVPADWEGTATKERKSSC